MTRALSTALVLALVSACGVPSSFDGVSGGSEGATDAGGIAQKREAPAPAAATPLTQDADLVAPRQISPISVSLVSTARPRFRWTLGEGLSGAIVELSRTHDFKGALKTYTVTGSELAVPDDLDLGVWFWRLKGVTSTSVGTTPSTVWEVLVRGPAANGSSDAPSRGMVDMNGDGEPDLIIAETAPDENPLVPTETIPVLWVLAGQPDHTFSLKVSDNMGGQEASPYTGPLSISGGTDLDGDGFTDIVEAGLWAYTDATLTKFFATAIYASRDPNYIIDWNRGGALYSGTDGTVLPYVNAGGDVDGDGYGDALLGLDNVSIVVLGSVTSGFSGLPIVPVDYGYGAASGHSRAALGGFDANGDGLTDVMFSYVDPTESGAFFAPGASGLHIGAPISFDAALSAPTAFATGDFNGDGLDDVAFTLAVGTSTKICVSYGDRTKVLTPGGCIAAPAGETEFGLSLTAADLEGDGVDEILATTKGTAYGIRVIRGADGDLSTTPVATATPNVGVRLTTIWPGRPGKARWAAAAADGSHVEIFEGDAFQSSVMADTGATGFGRGLR